MSRELILHAARSIEQQAAMWRVMCHVKITGPPDPELEKEACDHVRECEMLVTELRKSAARMKR